MYGYWGMAFWWWIFWVALIVLFFVFLTPVPRGRARTYRMTPLEELQRRYARGQITTAEYEERKAVLERDLLGAPPDVKRVPPRPPEPSPR